MLLDCPWLITRDTVDSTLVSTVRVFYHVARARSRDGMSSYEELDIPYVTCEPQPHFVT